MFIMFQNLINIRCFPLISLICFIYWVKRITYKSDQVDVCFLFVQQAFSKSLAPDMVDQVLKVLSVKELGKQFHAHKIKEVYHRNIANHKICGNCREGMVFLDIKHYPPSVRS